MAVKPDTKAGAASSGKRGGQAGNRQEGSRLGRELVGLLYIFFGLLLMLSLVTFDTRDPWLNHVVSEAATIRNRAGLFGAYVGGFLLDVLGYAAWIFPTWFCLIGARRILGAAPWPWWRWATLVLFAVVLAFLGAAHDVGRLAFVAKSAMPAHGGGMFGSFLFSSLVGWLSETGAWMVWALCLLLGIQMLVGFSWLSLLAGFAAMLWQTGRDMADEFMDKRQQAMVKRQPRLVSSAQPKPLEISIEPLPAPAAAPVQTSPPAQDSSVLQARVPIQSPSSNQASVVPKAEQATPRQVPVHHPEAAAISLHEADGTEEEFRESPPWLEDFEVGRLGVKAPHQTEPSLRPDFDHEAAPGMPLPSDDEETKNFFAILDEPWRDALQEQDIFSMPDTGFTIENRQAKPIFVETLTMQPEPAKPLAKQPELADPIAPPAMQEEGAAPMDPLAVQSPMVPLRQTAPDSVLEPVSPQSNAPPRSTTSPSWVALPSLDLVEALPSSSPKTPYDVLQAKGNALMNCLADFGIQGELVGITPGPVVTMFEVRPAPGVRVARIANLNDDLALALKAVAVRIQAPVPGTDTVGIEIPNEIREMVGLKELLASPAFSNSQSLLTLALGKDIAGNSAVTNLASMPHLLVAGATGAGKSVGINSIILSLLFKAKPDEVRLLLIDPKRVEMAIYHDLPHLVHPVVTDMAMAKNALDWAVKEMEQRYADIARAGVRNIADYNTKLKDLGDSRPDGLEGLEFMPYLVIIIDELADLMMVASKEVESSIVRLAQLARAAGIHLILATQRPSVDVVTGIIKANFPCRIAFQVTSKHDSRTILDTVGAEHLLGKGDMLFKPGGGRFQRMHGAFVSDGTVKAVVDYWKRMVAPSYGVDFADWGSPEGGMDGDFGAADISSDPLYAEAVEFVRQSGKASISLLQRRFRIGYNKAARLTDQMEQDGIIGPSDGSKPRPVLR